MINLSYIQKALFSRLGSESGPAGTKKTWGTERVPDLQENPSLVREEGKAGDVNRTWSVLCQRDIQGPVYVAGLGPQAWIWVQAGQGLQAPQSSSGGLEVKISQGVLDETKLEC